MISCSVTYSIGTYRFHENKMVYFSSFLPIYFSLVIITFSLIVIVLKSYFISFSWAITTNQIPFEPFFSTCLIPIKPFLSYFFLHPPKTFSSITSLLKQYPSPPSLNSSLIICFLIVHYLVSPAVLTVIVSSCLFIRKVSL